MRAPACCLQASCEGAHAQLLIIGCQLTRTHTGRDGGGCGAAPGRACEARVSVRHVAQVTMSFSATSSPSSPSTCTQHAQHASQSYFPLSCPVLRVLPAPATRSKGSQLCTLQYSLSQQVCNPAPADGFATLYLSSPSCTETAQVDGAGPCAAHHACNARQVDCRQRADRRGRLRRLLHRQACRSRNQRLS